MFSFNYLKERSCFCFGYGNGNGKNIPVIVAAFVIFRQKNATSEEKTAEKMFQPNR